MHWSYSYTDTFLNKHTQLFPCSWSLLLPRNRSDMKYHGKKKKCHKSPKMWMYFFENCKETRNNLFLSFLLPLFIQSFITNCPILMGTTTSMQTCHRIGPFFHPTLSHHEPCASLSLWLLSECLHDSLFLVAPDPEELQESIGCISLVHLFGWHR